MRPAPDREVPDGFELIAEEETFLKWRLVTGKRCRQPRCGRPSAAEMNRGAYVRGSGTRRVDRWWAYCGEHLYGRWIEDGKIMNWVLREREGLAALEAGHG